MASVDETPDQRGTAAAARALPDMIRKLPRPRGKKTDISAHVEDHLYGRGR